MKIEQRERLRNTRVLLCRRRHRRRSRGDGSAREREERERLPGGVGGVGESAGLASRAPAGGGGGMQQLSVGSAVAGPACPAAAAYSFAPSLLSSPFSKRGSSNFPLPLFLLYLSHKFGGFLHLLLRRCDKVFRSVVLVLMYHESW